MSHIKSLHSKFINKEISVLEHTKRHLEKAKEDNTKTNCYITITEKEAHEQAERIDKQIAERKDIPLLAGIPFSAKDIICTENILSTGASKILNNFIPPYSATAYQKIADQGAILIAKNNCDEFAQGGSNENSAYGPVKNPHDQTRVSGGSSGGSAASVSLGSSVFSIGTDTGGSIRQPASFCGCVGLKVTYGRTSRFGVMSMASSFDTIGPLTQTVEDSAILLEFMAGLDANDPTTLSVPVPKYTETLNNDLKGKVVGLPKEYFSDDVEADVKEHVMNAVKKLESLGCTIKEVSLPLTKYAIATYYILVPAEISANMSRYDGLRYGPTITDPKDLEDLYVSNRTNGFGDEVKRRILLGNFVLSHGYYDAYYKKAQKVRTAIINEFDNIFKEVDFLASPVSPTKAFKLGEKQDPLAMYMADVFTIPSATAGLPGLSLPVGMSDGLPIGLQLIGPRLSEGLLLNVGHVLEGSLK